MLIDDKNFLQGRDLLKSQVMAMTLKKLLFSLRSYKLCIIQCLIPALFVVITMLLETRHSTGQHSTALHISLDEYLSTETVIEKGNMSDTRLAEAYATMLGASGYGYLSIQSGMSAHILDTPPAHVNTKNMIAASFGENRITAWFNNQGYHTAPLSVNLVNNAILKSFTNDTEKVIDVTNKPLPLPAGSKVSTNVQLISRFEFFNRPQIKHLDDINNLGFKLAFYTAFGMALTTAMFSIFYLKERVSRAKLLQFLSGVNKFVFWLTSFVIDFLQFVLIVLIYLAVLRMYDNESYNHMDELLRNFVLMVTFGFAVLPFTYLLSFLFDASTTGFVKLVLIFIVTGDFSFFAYFTFNIPFLELEYIAKPFGKIANIFPHYSLARGMSNLYVKHSKINECDHYCDGLGGCKEIGVKGFCDSLKIDVYVKDFSNQCCHNSNFYSFDEDGLGRCLASLVVIGVASFILLFLIDFEMFKKLKGVAEKKDK